jgi:hypothetical protein
VNVQALKDEVRLMGWDNLLEDMEWPTRLAEGGTLATRGAGGEMTSRFVRGTIRARDHTPSDRVGRRTASSSIGDYGDWRCASPTGYDPWMSHGWTRLHSTVRVPGQAFTDEIDKELIVAFEHLSECFRVRSTSFAFGIDEWSRGACCV